MDDSVSVTTSFTGSSVDISLGNPSISDSNSSNATLPTNEEIRQLYLSRTELYSVAQRFACLSNAVSETSFNTPQHTSRNNVSQLPSRPSFSSNNNILPSPLPKTNSNNSRNKVEPPFYSNSSSLSNSPESRNISCNNISLSHPPNSGGNSSSGFLSTLRRSCSFLGSRSSRRSESRPLHVLFSSSQD